MRAEHNHSQPAPKDAADWKLGVPFWEEKPNLQKFVFTPFWSEILNVTFTTQKVLNEFLV